jgi:uncharacterized protein (TIGR00725 family)
MTGADERESAWVERVRKAARARPVVGVMGGSAASAGDLARAETFGRETAGAGWVVLTGGGPGIMEAASRGARLAGGLTVGVLPVEAPVPGYPNAFVSVPLFTGLGRLDPTTGGLGRNRINILASDVIVAFPGAAGTFSEIRLAAEHGKPLMLLGWTLDELDDATRDAIARHRASPYICPDPETAVRWLQARKKS